MDPTDETLMKSWQHGDATAFGDLVRRYSSPLYGYLLRLCGNRQEAEDLFQETFERVASRRHQYRDGRPFKPWLYGIASHLATDRFRWARRRPTLVGVDEADPILGDDPSPDEAAQSGDLKRLVRAAIDSLPPRQRATLILVYYQQMTYPEAAECLGCSLGTVKTQMSRAMRTLAQRLPDGVLT